MTAELPLEPSSDQPAIVSLHKYRKFPASKCGRSILNLTPEPNLRWRELIELAYEELHTVTKATDKDGAETHIAA